MKVSCFVCAKSQDPDCPTCKGTRETEFTIADATEVGYLQEDVDYVLNVIADITQEQGIREAFVSDESSLDHFTDDPSDLKELKECFEMPDLNEEALIIDIAKHVRKGKK